MVCKACDWGLCDGRQGICRGRNTTPAHWLEPGPATSTSKTHAEAMAEACDTAATASMNARAAADFAKHLAEVAEHASVCAEVAWNVAEQARRVAIVGAIAEEPELKELSAREKFAIAVGGAQETAQAVADSVALINGLKEATEAAQAAALAAQQAAEAAWSP